MNLPKRIVQKQHESESYAILIYKLRKLGIFRNLTENDYGIDFEIEVVKRWQSHWKVCQGTGEIG